MKLSRRGKRTKRTKRTKNIKCRRNTKKQFRQYKRKNTYRKHSHKLRKNKRVMRGGVENFGVVYEKKNVELEYTTSDMFSRFKNLLGRLQKVNFTVLLTYDSNEISDTIKTYKPMEYTFASMKETLASYFEDAQRAYDDNSKFKSTAGNAFKFKSFFIPDNPDTYEFTLTLYNTKDNKLFKVKFIVKVKKYMFIFFKEAYTSTYNIQVVGDIDINNNSPLILGNNENNNLDKNDFNGITYSSDDTNGFNAYDIMEDNPPPFTIVRTGEQQKNYMFPMNEHTSHNNNSFFRELSTTMKQKIANVYQEKLKSVFDSYIEEQKSITPQQLTA